jgi:hypothetical protein
VACALARGRPERSESRDDDFLGQHVGIMRVVGFFEAFVSEQEDVEAGFVAIMR